MFGWGARRVSNPQPPEPQSGALPLSYGHHTRAEYSIPCQERQTRSFAIIQPNKATERAISDVMNQHPTIYDVIVIGAGHAGCEAAHAAARMGCRTLLLTIDLDKLAHMSCNPSIGGPAKGHLVREIDALGGLMGSITDQSFIQIRLLNESKGPAVQALRAQADKRLYARVMKEAIEATPNLDLKQAMVERIVPPQRTENKEQRTEAGTGPLFSVLTHTGRVYQSRALVLTTGTFLRGRAITADAISGARRAGDAPAVALGQDLASLGFPLVRLKTGTPPRIDARTIDFALTDVQHGSDVPR